MASVAELKALIAAEKAEVDAKLIELHDEIVALKEALEVGDGVTPEDLDDLAVLVKGIITPEEVPVEEPVVVEEPVEVVEE